MAETKWKLLEGQWGDHSDGKGGGFHVICQNELPLKCASLVSIAEDVYPEDPSYPRAKANAHLIAAAPELYEALKRAREMLRAVAGDIEDGISFEMRGKVIAAIDGADEAARAALRKARGEA